MQIIATRMRRVLTRRAVSAALVPRVIRGTGLAVPNRRVLVLMVTQSRLVPRVPGARISVDVVIMVTSSLGIIVWRQMSVLLTPLLTLVLTAPPVGPLFRAPPILIQRLP